MSKQKQGNRELPVHPNQQPQWLTLKDASEILGVHFTTLRTWADNGEIRVFRTPGGHRRFSVGDLRRFLQERVGQAEVADSDTFVDVAVDRVRAEIAKMPPEQQSWRTQLSTADSSMQRQRGRELFALAISYVMKPGQRERILASGRQLGREYGQEAAANEISLRETGRAVQFFRSQLVQILRGDDNQPVLDADDVRVQQMVNHFLDEVLYAVLDGYEEYLVTD